MSKLLIELVPKTAWFSNLRSELTAAEWDLVRRASYKAAGQRCEICSGRGHAHPVECHEVWDYDFDTCIQTLVRTIALCPACHEVKHFGLAQIKGREAAARAHLIKTNNWSGDQADLHIQQAFDIWEERNQIDWRLDARWLLEKFEVSAETRLKIENHATGLVAY